MWCRTLLQVVALSSVALLYCRILGIKKAARLGGLGVRRVTHAYRIMMIAMLDVLAPK
jgi:hypothetical protein